jgi:hypothetical protein
VTLTETSIAAISWNQLSAPQTTRIRFFDKVEPIRTIIGEP